LRSGSSADGKRCGTRERAHQDRPTLHRTLRQQPLSL